jgi:hypothetical protein
MNERIMRFFIVILLLCAPLLRAQQIDEPDATVQPLSIVMEMKGYGIGRMLGNPSRAFAPRLNLPAVDPVYSKKSPFLAGVFSVIIPGTGELYAGSYWLAGLFAALEGGLWYYNIDQNDKGDVQTTVYRQYADQHWSVVKYAQWLNENAKDFPGGENAVPIPINPDVSLPLWERVDWDAMHQTEMAIPQFSHKLPPYGDQQYFELIGKYNQYSYGWDDKNGGDYWNISDNFAFYSGQRGKANDFYNTADAMLNLIFLNHVLSAIDAAWAAARFNKFVELYAHAQLMRLPSGQAEVQTMARFSVRL